MSISNHFLILSSGYCGSLWLAASLDKHPDISCTCNALIGLGVPHDGGFDFASQDPGVVDAMVLDQGIGCVDDLFDRVEARKLAKAAGDVHGYRVSTYRAAVARQAHRQAQLAHLVRHPAVLLERITLEQIHRFKTHARMQAMMTANFPRVCQALEPLLSGIGWEIGADLRGLGFLFALNEVLMMADDVESAPEIKLWTFEQLISDREVFARLVDDITGGAVAADTAYLDQIFKAENLENSGRYRKTAVNMASRPEGVFAAWDEQEREAFRRLVRMRGLAQLYDPAGYDFTFAA